MGRTTSNNIPVPQSDVYWATDLEWPTKRTEISSKFEKKIKNLIKDWDGPHQTTFGSNSLTSIAPQIWNGLPNELKSAVNLKKN